MYATPSLTLKSAHTDTLPQNAPVPPGRNVSACLQKINKMKNALRAEIDALKTGEPLPTSTAEATPRKRKAKAKGEDANGDAADGSPKKRGRGRLSKKKEAEAKAEAEEREERIKSEMMDEDVQSGEEA